MSDFTEPLTSSMDNLLAYKLGCIALKVERTDRKYIGDEIDRGLILRRYLEEEGFYLVRLTRAAQQRDEAAEGGAAKPSFLVECSQCDSSYLIFDERLYGKCTKCGSGPIKVSQLHELV